MFTKITFIFVTIILLASMAGCGAKSTPTPGSSEEGSQEPSSETSTETNAAEDQQMLPIISGKVADIEFDASADGTTQQLEKGDVLSITLESNPSTGYGWYANISDPQVIAQMGEPQYQEPSGSGTPIVGAPGKQVFFLQATETGSATVTMEYKRAWETDVAPEKTIVFTVEVK